MGLINFTALSNNKKPEVLQKSKKDNNLNVDNSLRIKKIVNACALLDINDYLSEDILDRISTEIAECLSVMVLEYPLTDQFNIDKDLLFGILKLPQSLREATEPKYYKFFRQEGEVSRKDRLYASFIVFKMLHYNFEI